MPHMPRSALAAALLEWYAAAARKMPWRGQSDPYKIWISEIMLQQTPRLWVDNTVSPTTPGLFSWSSATQLDQTPRPRAQFDQMRDGVAVRLTDPDTGAAVALDADVAPMAAGGDPAEALETADYRYTVAPGPLDEDPVRASSSIYSGENMTLRAMPEALAVSFAGWEQTYTCTAYPSEVRP